MDITQVRVAYFSPTGTTQAVARAIADGIGCSDTEFLDITTPGARKQGLRIAGDQLLVMAVPVYMGRVPALLKDWFDALKARRTPAVCVVVYGNRAYENALRELADLAASRGCIPVAGAAFIGEHSFSNPEQPASKGRPDGQDLAQARALGDAVRKRIESCASVSGLDPVQVPGERPYGGITKLWDVDFIAVSDACVQCGLCAEVCPVGAVDPQDSRAVDAVKCVTCCACIRRCPQGARSIKPGPVKEAAKRLVTLYAEPKQPQCFL